MAKDRPVKTPDSIPCDVVRDLREVPFHQCLSCTSPLDLHQPDLDQPDRLLATCGSCGSWFILDGATGRRSALAIRIPGMTELHRRLAGKRPRAREGEPDAPG